MYSTWIATSRGGESQPADLEKAADILAVSDLKDSRPAGFLNNPAECTPDVGIVTVAEVTKLCSH